MTGDPRKRIRYEGIGFRAITLKIDASTITYSATEENGSAAVGMAVTLKADDTVELAGDGEFVAGKLLEVFADNTCTVQIAGFCTLPAGAGASTTLGYPIVGDLDGNSAEGYVREVASATAAEICKGRGKIWADDTTTALVIEL